MNERGSKNSPLSPSQRLANVYGSLANDVFDIPLDADEETNERAVRLAQAALEKALASDPVSDSSADSVSKPSSSPKNMSANSAVVKPSPRNRRLAWLARWFGLHPATAMVLTLLALVFNRLYWGPLALGSYVTLPIGGLVGVLTYFLQTRFYKEDGLPLVFKGIAVPVLIVLPVPVAPFVLLPAGLLGMIWEKSLQSELQVSLPSTDENAAKTVLIYPADLRKSAKGISNFPPNSITHPDKPSKPKQPPLS